MVDEPILRFGKLPYVHDKRTLMLSSFVDRSALPPPPSSVNWQKNVTEWPLYANDTLGDCTCAAFGHMFQAWTAAQGKEFRPTEKAIVDMYWATGKDDTGRYMIDILKYVQKKSLVRRKIGPYALIEPGDHSLVRQAIASFGGIYVGFAVPPNVFDDFFNGRIWDAGPPPVDAGHAVNAVGYGDNIQLVTWGRLMGATWRWWDQYVQECWVALPSSWRTKDPIPNFSYERLEKELKGLGVRSASFEEEPEEDAAEEAPEPAKPAPKPKPVPAPKPKQQEPPVWPKPAPAPQQTAKVAPKTKAKA